MKTRLTSRTKPVFRVEQCRADCLLQLLIVVEPAPDLGDPFSTNAELLHTSPAIAHRDDEHPMAFAAWARIRQRTAVDTRGGSRMRESRTYGSVRRARGNSRPYRERCCLLRCMSPELCRFSDAGTDALTARSVGRRPKSAKAGNRVGRYCCGSAAS